MTVWSDMDHLLVSYERWMRSWGASERTISARLTVAKNRLLAWGLDGFTKEGVEEYLSSEPSWSAWTRSTYFQHLNSWGTWLAASGHIEFNPMEDLRPPRRPKSKPRPLSADEEARVLASVTGDMRVWVLLALRAGLRAHEIAKIRGQDVTAEGIYVHGKGGKIEILPCHSDITYVARDYPRVGYWFPGSDNGHIRRMKISLDCGRFFRSLGIDGSVHRCRHTYGTKLLRNGVHIRTVQKLMRHANLETTANYTAVDEDEMRRAIATLPTAV